MTTTVPKPTDLDPEVITDADTGLDHFLFKTVPVLFHSPAPEDEQGRPILQPDRLQTVLAFIEANPNLWKQDAWHCETAGCLAGLSVDLSGGVWEVSARGTDSLGKPWIEISTDAAVPFLNDGHAHTASYLAQEILGLTYHQGDVLFYADNTLDDLRSIIAALIDPTKTVRFADFEERYDENGVARPGVRPFVVEDVA